MGLYGSSVTQKTEIPPPTPEELENMALESALIEQMMNSQGFDVDRKAVQTFENPAKVEALQETTAGLEDQLAQLQADLTSARQSNDTNAATRIQQQMGSVQAELGRSKRELSNEMDKSTTSVDVDLIKRDDPRVTSLREQGKEAEAAALEQQLEANDLKKLDDMDEVNALFLDAAKKFFSGDLSVTEQQQADLEAGTQRIRGPVLSAISAVERQVGVTEGTVLEQISERGEQISETYRGITDALSNVEGQIRQTGLNVDEALVEAEARVKQTGVDLNEALDQSIEASRSLAEQNLFSQTRDLRVKSSTLAANLGRSDLDPAFISQLQDDVSDATTAVELNMSAQAAQGRLAIAERTGAALENIQNLRVGRAAEEGAAFQGVAQQRAALEEQTGLRREALLGQRADIMQAAGLRREDLARSRANLEESLAMRQEAARTALAQGLPIQQVQMGGQFQAQQQALAQQPFVNLSNIQNQVGSTLRRQLGERVAQPTTTRTTSPSIFSGILSGIGVAGSAFGSATTGIGALRQSANIGG